MRYWACVQMTCSPQARFLTQAIAFRSPPSQRDRRVVMRDNRVQGRFSSVFCAFFPARGTAAQAHGRHAPAQTRPAPVQSLHAPAQMFHAQAQMFRAQAQETSARAQQTHALGQIAAAQAQHFGARCPLDRAPCLSPSLPLSLAGWLASALTPPPPARAAWGRSRRSRRAAGWRPGTFWRHRPTERTSRGGPCFPART